MTPEVSEFSYGFALTNEIVGWATLRAAPIFPSLIEEGKAGGGYDVKLETPGIPLYLQFKRADCMIRATASEISKKGLNLQVPFYRFAVTQSDKSDQHEMLRALDDGANAVFYAAPRFYQLSEINHAWSAKEVAARSIFVRPNTIGPLDEKSHRVAYDDHHAYVCSEPKEIQFLTAVQVAAHLAARLAKESRPLRATLRELNDSLTEAWTRGRKQAELRLAHEAAAELQSATTTETAVDANTSRTLGATQIRNRGVPTRDSAPLSEPAAELRRLADNAVKLFDAQVVIVQTGSAMNG